MQGFGEEYIESPMSRSDEDKGTARWGRQRDSIILAQIESGENFAASCVIGRCASPPVPASLQLHRLQREVQGVPASIVQINLQQTYIPFSL